MQSISQCLISKNPLTRKIASFLISYQEEDERIDYKLLIDTSSEKHWLELTKDISSFANTFGGYLIVGIKDKSKKIVGISRNSATLLKDVNNILQKINRHLEPQLTAIRSNEFRFKGHSIVVIMVPQSKGLTHFIFKDGEFRHPSGKKKVVLHQGTFYVRRSGSNHIGDSRDFDQVIERRIDQFRQALMDKVAKVVSSPSESDVFILSKDSENTSGDKFIIQDAPDSIPIKGMSFTVAPEGPEQEIAAWTALSSEDSKNLPPPELLWSWYLKRIDLQLSKNHSLSLFKLSLWLDAPFFYWIKDLRSIDIQSALFDAVRLRPIGCNACYMLETASFLGKSVYNKVLKALGNYVKQLGRLYHSFPSESARNGFGYVKGEKKLTELESIIKKAVAESRQPGLRDRWTAHKIDCHIYANKDNYS